MKIQFENWIYHAKSHPIWFHCPKHNSPFTGSIISYETINIDKDYESKFMANDENCNILNWSSPSTKMAQAIQLIAMTKWISKFLVTWTDSMRNKVYAVWTDQQIFCQHNIEMFQWLLIRSFDRWMDVPGLFRRIEIIGQGANRSLAISSFKYPIRIQSSAVWPFKYLDFIDSSVFFIF